MIRKKLSNIIIGTSLVGIVLGGLAFGYTAFEKGKSAARLQTAEYFAPQVANLNPLDMACYTEDMATTTKNALISRFAFGSSCALYLVGSLVGIGTSRREEEYAGFIHVLDVV